MDEIDAIILHTLRQIGCNLDEDLSGLDEIKPSLLVPIVSRCIALIDPSLELPKTLPPGMAQRFTATASLAEACRAIGYRRDIGYQTFLYSNVTEVRRVLMFLIERLPKDTTDKAEGARQPADRATILENQIVSNLQAQLQAPWMPEFCRIDGTEPFVAPDKNPASTSATVAQAKIAFQQFIPKKLNIPFVTHSDLVKEIQEFWSRRSLESLDQDTLVPSLIAANDGAIKSNQPIDAIDEGDARYKFPLAPEKLLSKYFSATGSGGPDISQVKQVKPNTSLPADAPVVESTNSNPVKLPLESLQREIDQLRTEIDKSKELYVQLQTGRQQQDESVEMHKKALAKLKEDKKFKERTHILLEDPEVNVKKLEAIIAAGGERMKKLQDQWDAHRTPLVETLEVHKAKNSDILSRSQPILDQIESTRRKCEEITIDLQTKSAMHLRLQKEFEKLNKTVSRTAYTSRILEIVGNIRKQKNDIDKILQDTRSLQKEINSITGQLDRQFTVTDDLIFRNAKKDEYAKRAYKLLVMLHSDCAELIGLVQETGAIKREIRDLEDQIENEKTRNTAANLAQITNDLTEMQNESLRLEESIRELEEAIRRQ
ncbi:coiled-coil domain-containing protein 22 homolog [Sabethes cyaneus]|uniref:coiled-coil domain-containing protein 22 homolog n=1 Tax=Sabethes cyaneus TaxID=53552 RepID=UPI00221E31A5|nr:coiled-coil domain-containing protein 22 homolog [Sabethes cyaneus]XP_053684090.1 coiled-coil domain-containing protein 22 homolog [Sabethes cyaneus]